MNRIIIAGRVGSIDGRSTETGKIVAGFSVATSTKRKGQEYTEWHRCTAWEKLAEVIINHVSVGDQVIISGSMRYSKYNDRDGVERYSATIAVDEFEFAAKKREGNNETRINISE